MASASVSERAIGFSTMTCLPARIASIAIAACRPLGVQMLITSMSARASSSR